MNFPPQIFPQSYVAISFQVKLAFTEATTKAEPRSSNFVHSGGGKGRWKIRWHESPATHSSQWVGWGMVEYVLRISRYPPHSVVCYVILYLGFHGSRCQSRRRGFRDVFVVNRLTFFSILRLVTFLRGIFHLNKENTTTGLRHFICIIKKIWNSSLWNSSL